MPLVKLDNLHLHYGEQVIFDGVDLQLNPGERICIVGRNGAGKSTLLKAIDGKVEPDGGHSWRDPAVTIASLSQDLPNAEQLSVFDFVAGGLKSVVDDLHSYQRLSTQPGDIDLQALEKLQHRIEAADGWSLENKIAQVLTQLDLDGDRMMSDLSGGWRRRVSLAQALVCEPDVLLLDEPTNHLDIAAIEWLEQHLLKFAGAIVFVTHDRAFLRAVANKIGELDRGVLSLWDGDYAGFLVFKEQQLEVEARHNALFDKRLAQEEVWVRQGIKARRTRNEGRVRALKKMRDERAGRREVSKTATIVHTSDTISGKLVAELKGVSFGWGTGKQVINNFTSTIIRGDKIGLIGPNGIGKSTFLKILLGDLEPEQGSVKIGTKLSVAYFDQMRDQLDVEKTAIDNIGGGRDTIEVDGRSKHIISYLADFLFSGERARTPIKALSGGERNRVLLAKLFSKPSNLLVMDEPTNDLDAETLELLESLLVDYDGTLLLVSHDREFLDNVVTSSIAFEGNGKLIEYIGGYEDWIRQGGHWPGSQGSAAAQQAEQEDQEVKVALKPAAKKAAPPKKQLSYQLQRELTRLPAELEALEVKIADLHERIGGADFYQQDEKAVNDVLAELAEQESLLQQQYGRWEELEVMSEA
ncbi:MAG: ABC transporter ATP-binding protein [Alteromonadaceae bacterium]|nr:MAG: ABC transporter ATP-binding protein [Alteromonadaceae bacterium]